MSRSLRLQLNPRLVDFYRAVEESQRKAQHYQAWQVINLAQGKPGNGGRGEALKDLIEDNVPLSDVDLAKADLLEARLAGGLLFRANLTGANLGLAKLTHANLVGANLSHADLGGATLAEAFLLGANLTGANLTSPNLTGADLKGANLTDLRRLSCASLQQAANWSDACRDIDLASARPARARGPVEPLAFRRLARVRRSLVVPGHMPIARTKALFHVRLRHRLLQAAADVDPKVLVDPTSAQLRCV